MFDLVRRNVKFLLAIALILGLGMTTPAVAHGVQHALFAHNADKVDGKHASWFATKQAPAPFKSAIMSPRSQALTTTGKTFASVSVTVPATCGANTRATYVLRGAAWGNSYATTATARMWLGVNSNTVTYGPGFTLVQLANGEHASLASQRVVQLAPGTHTIHLAADVFSGSGYLGDAVLTAEGQGYHCNGGPTPRVVAPRKAGTATGQ
jgi:hypothetical protein